MTPKQKDFLEELTTFNKSELDLVTSFDENKNLIVTYEIETVFINKDAEMTYTTSCKGIKNSLQLPLRVLLRRIRKSKE